MSWLRLMIPTPERQSAGDILFLGGGSVRTLVPSAAQSSIPTTDQRGSLGTARAGTHWTWATPTRSDDARRGPVALPTQPFGEGGPSSRRSAKRDYPWPSGHEPASATVAVAQDIHCLRTPRDTMRQMELVAARLGRSESEVWSEAAHEWLARRAGVVMLFDDDRDDDPPPAAPTALPLPLRPQRSWTAIDALLADLRAPADPSVA